ncbi:unnamed protein product [Caenorhabditis bovis]|uniref:Vacuolar protein sorting-associated protein 54 n=1 Tax=Caenorhabditis bovis TaxID=2654633 RepID=A0A8S1EAT1_9PELO|nr:unnamed protein product [Caenorhabditis bovis]
MENLGKKEMNTVVIYSPTQNLSAVLADPNRSRSETSSFFTRHWGDQFVPVTTIPPSKHLKRVSSKNIEKYSKTTGELYQRYRSIRRALRISYGDGGAFGDEKQDADDLPTIFIDPRFSLSDPSTFSTVFTIPSNENADALRRTLSGRNVVPATPAEVSANLKPGQFRDYDSLHGRLEMMHDVVDGRLAAKLVSKTDDFWQVVRSYSGLQEQLAVAMKSVKNVRSSLKQVDELICEQSKKIVQIHEKNEQKKKLLTKLNDIACLREAQSTVQMMLSQGDYPKAIECIETSLEVLSGVLNGVTCFRHLSSQLRELYDVIGRMMNEDFATTIQRELGMKPDSGNLIQAEGELSAVLLGLMRMRKYAFIGVLREEIREGVNKVMRQVVKTSVLKSGVDLSDFDPSLSKLSEPVRRMKHQQFVEAINTVMRECYEFCVRLEAIQELMLEIADRAHPPTEATSDMVETIKDAHFNDESGSEDTSDDSDPLNTSIHSNVSAPTSTSNASATTLMSIEVRSEAFLRKVLHLIAEYGHQCTQHIIAKLLIARAKNAVLTESTTPTQLCELLSLVSTYQKRCERWSSTQSFKAGHLSKAVNKLSMDYIEKFHASRKIRIGNMLDTELWKAVEISQNDQRMIDMSLENFELRNFHNNLSSGESTPKASSPSSGLMIGEENYVVVGSCVAMIKILADYCEAVSQMPHFAQDWNSRIIELLKTYNSRCCQLILGAGALQLVGLKTISVRNLALAARSLELVIRLIPMIRDEIDEVLPDEKKNLLRYFKQVECEYKDHVAEITLKLINVIDHYTVSCLQTWEVSGTIPSKEFQQICRHMTKFHNGLFGIMPKRQIQALFEKVHENFKNNLKERLEEMKITPHDSLKFGYVTKDYMFYQQNLTMMESCRSMETDSLNDILFTN